MYSLALQVNDIQRSELAVSSGITLNISYCSHSQLVA